MRPLLAALPLSLLSLLLTVVAQDEGSPPDYAPNVNQSCPDVSTTPLVRVFTPGSQTLHPDEASFISDRLNNVVPKAWTDWIGDGSAIGYNLSALTAPGNDSVKIGISISGGGYRAAQYGAGVLSGLDARNDSAKAAGTGGLLQVTSYLSGLSGECVIRSACRYSSLKRIARRRLVDNGLSILQRLSDNRATRVRRRSALGMVARHRPRHAGRAGPLQRQEPVLLRQSPVECGLEGEQMDVSLHISRSRVAAVLITAGTETRVSPIPGRA